MESRTLKEIHRELNHQYLHFFMCIQKCALSKCLENLMLIAISATCAKILLNARLTQHIQEHFVFLRKAFKHYH